MGLLMEALKLLVCSVILADTHGKARYIQVVPEMTHMQTWNKRFPRPLNWLKKNRGRDGEKNSQ